MLKTITSKQFYEWMIFYQVEPFGEIRQEIRHGQLMAQTANINRDINKKREPFTATDFMSFYEKPKKSQEPEAVKMAPDEMRRKIFSPKRIRK